MVATATRSWLAAILSLIDTPLGLLYVGHLKLAVAYWLVVQVVYVLISVAVASGRLNAVMLLTALIALLLVRLAAIGTAWRLASRAAPTRRWFQRWQGLLLGLVLFTGITTGIQMMNRAFVLESFIVPGRSMDSTINHLDRVFVDKLFARADKLRRRDLVVFRVSPDGPIFVSRVVGLQGDTLSLKERTLLVNGEAVKEPYASYRESPHSAPELNETIVPPNHFFVLGDNRNFSNDSRTIGPIALANYYGRPTNIFYSRHYESTDSPEMVTIHKPGPIAWERIGKRLSP